MPMSMSIEPTTSCNLRCPQCPSGLRSFTRPTGMLQGDLFKQLVDSQQKTLVYLTLYFQGEPYLNPDFLEMVNYAANKGIFTATSTNAHYLNPQNAEETVKSKLDKIIISIDGIDQDSYAKYRVGGKLSKVLEGTKNLMEAKRRLKSVTPHVIWQFIVFAHNEHQIPELKKLAKELQIDQLAIKTAQVYDYENGHELIPQTGKYSRYKIENGMYKIKNHLLNHCWRMWQGCVVTWDGKIVPCCFDKDATHQLGNMKIKPFNEIWKSPEYHSFRGLILKGREHIDICRNCSEGTSVWASVE